MKYKICTGCKMNKPLDDFYKHPKGRLGRTEKCKECIKTISNNYRNNNLEKVKKYDRKRSLLPHRKIIRKEYYESHKYLKSTKIARAISNRKWRENNIIKYKAHNIIASTIQKGNLHSLPCVICKNPNSEAHHEDYNKPLDIIWLCKQHHEERHRELKRLINEKKKL